MSNKAFHDPDQDTAGMAGYNDSGFPVVALETEAKTEGILAEIIQQLLEASFPMPRAVRLKGGVKLIWLRGDILLELMVSDDGCLGFECTEKHRDSDGDVLGTERIRGFLSHPEAIDQLMVVLYRPEAREA